MERWCIAASIAASERSRSLRKRRWFNTLDVVSTTAVSTPRTAPDESRKGLCE
jgi:hypothetical protein